MILMKGLLLGTQPDDQCHSYLDLCMDFIIQATEKYSAAICWANCDILSYFLVFLAAITKEI